MFNRNGFNLTKFNTSNFKQDVEIIVDTKRLKEFFEINKSNVGFTSIENTSKTYYLNLNLTHVVNGAKITIDERINKTNIENRSNVNSVIIESKSQLKIS